MAPKIKPDLKCPFSTCSFGNKQNRSRWSIRRHLWSHVKMYSHVKLACKMCSRVFGNFQAALGHGINRCNTTCLRCRKEMFGRNDFHETCPKIETDTHRFALMPFAMILPAEISILWPDMLEEWRNLRDRFGVVIRPILKPNHRVPKRKYSKPQVNQQKSPDETAFKPKKSARIHKE